MQIKVDKKDLEQLLKKLERGDSEKIILKAMTELAGQTLAAAKKNTPVVSGELRRGWHPEEVSPQRVVISNNVSYAEYVEYGHRQEPGRFVPKLGKRLKSSWVKGVFYAQRTEEMMRKKADNIVRPIVIRELKELLNDK